MFHADITFVFAILTLVAGAYLVLNAKIHKEISTVPCKIIGYIAVILSILMLLFSGYGMIKRCAMRHTMIKKSCMHQIMRSKMPMRQMKCKR